MSMIGELQECTKPEIVHHLDAVVVEHGVEYQPGWYFWHETWADRSGPFDSCDQAEQELSRYMTEFLGYDQEDQG